LTLLAFKHQFVLIFCLIEVDFRMRNEP
jgi:hypothetical protein